MRDPKQDAGFIVGALFSQVLPYDRRDLKWYAGITNDIERRKGEHNIQPEDLFFFEEAPSEKIAREAEAQLHERGFEGGGGGGEGGSVYVYVYLIQTHTIQDTGA